MFCLPVFLQCFLIDSKVCHKHLGPDLFDAKLYISSNNRYFSWYELYLGPMWILEYLTSLLSMLQIKTGDKALYEQITTFWLAFFQTDSSHVLPVFTTQVTFVDLRTATILAAVDRLVGDMVVRISVHCWSWQQYGRQYPEGKDEKDQALYFLK